MQLFDTHAHLDQADFDADRTDVVQRARDAGVQNIISIGTTADTSEICVRLAAEFAGVHAAVGLQPNPKAAVAVFGLFHGFGLATKLQAVNLSPDGLVVNMVSFNVGVELGQLVALAVMLAVFTPWRRSGRFEAQALSANWVLMTAGFVLMGFHLTGYLRG